MPLQESKPPNLREFSAEELARQAQAGNSAAMDTLVARYGDRLTRFLHRRCGNTHDAEDLRQEALLRVWTHLDKYDPDRPFEPWLFAVAGNLAISRQRSRRLDAQVPPGPGPVAEAADPSQRLAEQERAKGLWSTARDLLTERQYVALWLRYSREMSIQEVACEMGLTRTHVKVTLFRARRRLAASQAMARWV